MPSNEDISASLTLTGGLHLRGSKISQMLHSPTNESSQALKSFARNGDLAFKTQQDSIESDHNGENTKGTVAAKIQPPKFTSRNSTLIRPTQKSYQNSEDKLMEKDSNPLGDENEIENKKPKHSLSMIFSGEVS